MGEDYFESPGQIGQKIPVLMPLSTIGTEAKLVADLKDRANKVLAELCSVMDEATRAGFAVRWAGIQANQFLRHEVVDLHLEKRY
jgi:hypothetical protein